MTPDSLRKVFMGYRDFYTESILQHERIDTNSLYPEQKEAYQRILSSFRNKLDEAVTVLELLNKLDY